MFISDFLISCIQRCLFRKECLMKKLRSTGMNQWCLPIRLIY